MAQITVRLDERLAEDLRARARAGGWSVNGFVVAVLRAAVDPDYEGSEAERTRARLARAGLLAVPAQRQGGIRPDAARLARARSVAGRGTPLSELVGDERG